MSIYYFYQLTIPEPRSAEVLIRYFYVIIDGNELTSQEISNLEDILNAEHHTLSPKYHHFHYYEIASRAEMVSPWCSNVLTVLHRLGLKQVVRIETSFLYPKNYYYLKDGNQEEEGEKGERKKVIPFDAMTQQVCNFPGKTLDLHTLKLDGSVRDDTYIYCPQRELELANTDLNLGFDQQDIGIYHKIFEGRKYLTDAELTDLAQSNSEHSRHWLFNGLLWHQEEMKYLGQSLFDLIKIPIKTNPQNSLIAMKDNSSAIRGTCVPHYRYNFITGRLEIVHRQSSIGATWLHPILTAETHNFPTGIAPRPGSATGVGGRIRDIQAMGQGGQMIAGIGGYSVGAIPTRDKNKKEVSEKEIGEETVGEEEEGEKFEYPLHSPTHILIQASDGASDYGNKIGEPMIQGFCRSFGKILKRQGGQYLRSEYVKPIMFSAGVGQIFGEHLRKEHGELGYLIVRLGGPAYRIGVGGGSASSQSQDVDDETEMMRLRTAVQRDNPEMENRMQKVLRTCVELGDQNPIISIHDQGAGGMGNVTKEIIMDATPKEEYKRGKMKQERLGGLISLGNVVSGDPTLSARELWTAEYQEQNTILIHPRNSKLIKQICEREGCPVAFVGVLTDTGRCEVYDPSVDWYQNPISANPVNFELEKVLGKMPPKRFTISNKLWDNSIVAPDDDLIDCEDIDIDQALSRVLGHLSVGSKRFLTNKVDRSVSGMIAQQQCVGPFQTPLSDYGLVVHSLLDNSGIATALGEQPIKGLLNPQRMVEQTVGEMLTNLVWVKWSSFEDIKCSGNWMWEKSDPEECYALYLAVQRVSKLLVELGIAIDGGKDSLSMSAKVGNEKVISPRTLVMTAYVTVPDIRCRVTPDLKQVGNHLIYVDLGYGQYRLGGSIIIQEYSKNSLGDECPGINSAEDFKNVLQMVQKLLALRLIQSGHDRSDGGLISCLTEMVIASPYGLKLDLSSITHGDLFSILFAEELGLVMEVRETDVSLVMSELKACSSAGVYDIGLVIKEPELELYYEDACYTQRISTLRAWWEKPSYLMELRQCLEKCAQAEYDMLSRDDLHLHVPQHYLAPVTKERFMHLNDLRKSDTTCHGRMKVAILRDMGSNGDREMAHAFYVAGFEPVDVTMTDLMTGRYQLGEGDFRGLVFVGGFTFADALGAGRAWALSIKHNGKLWDDFQKFKNRPDTFSLGICNGCQLMSELGWVQGQFINNVSGRFESRFSNVKIHKSNAIMLEDMEDSVLGIWVAHGEGRYVNKTQGGSEVLSYVNSLGEVTMEYPDNPNGSQSGVAGVCSEDGRHLAMMPHPERCIMGWQVPWIAPGLKKDIGEKWYPWVQMFRNAYLWCLEE